MKEIIVTLDQLHKVARDLIKKVYSLKNETATVLAFEGELGSGKTTLTQEIAHELGIKEKIISPTFVIMKKYKLPIKIKSINNRYKHLIHIDAYRLNKSEELFKLGWQEVLSDKTNLIIIEWPSQVPECIPTNACRLELSHSKKNTRTIKFSY